MSKEIEVVNEEVIEEKKENIFTKCGNAIEKHKKTIVTGVAVVTSATIGYMIGKKFGVSMPEISTENVVDGILESVEEAEEF